MLTLRVIQQSDDRDWTSEIPITWESVFRDAEPEIHDIAEILNEQETKYGSFYPMKNDIFAAFHYTQLNSVKVVILGQDPYHQSVFIDGKTVPRAVGLSFSVRQKDTIPSSLKNIYTELANTVRGFRKPDHGDLREWARQGVLLLNSCLTVRPGEPGSHGDIWLGFINKVFKAIAIANPYCIFLLWGRHAQKLRAMLGERSIIYEAAHPSGLSASKGFFGCNHFNLVNESLIRQGKVGINWSISTLAQLNNPSVPRQLGLPPATASIHQPIFVPVDINMLPTIITSTKSSPPEKEILLSREKQKTPAPLLPTIPNTKLTSQTILSTKPSTPRLTILPNPTPSAPTIPAITFGASLNDTPIIPIKLNVQNQPQQIISLPTLHEDKYQPTPAIIGLPIINPVV